MVNSFFVTRIPISVQREIEKFFFMAMRADMRLSFSSTKLKEKPKLMRIIEENLNRAAELEAKWR